MVSDDMNSKARKVRRVTITRKKFAAYLAVRQSGLTNMFDVPVVIKLARLLAQTTLTYFEILEIIQNFQCYERGEFPRAQTGDAVE